MQGRKLPTMFMLAGPNGAGKSTLYEVVIKPKVNAPFINADLIQRDELKNPSMDASYQAAQIAEARRQEHLANQKSFVSESTFSHPSKLSLVKDAKEAGFRVVIYHVNVRSPNLSVARVANRVTQGGHNVPEDKIRERYQRNQSLIREAALSADRAFIYDNSKIGSPPKLVIAFNRGVVNHAADDVPTWCRELYSKELQHFSASRLNAAAASFSDLKGIAERIVLPGEDAKIYIPNPKTNTYTGKIVGESTLHYLQKDTSGRYFAHFKTAVETPLAMGQIVTLNYKDKYHAEITGEATRKPVTDSLNKAKAAASELGLNASKATPNNTYSGEIVATSALHLVQKVSPSTAVIHFKEILKKPLKIGDNCKINYKTAFSAKVDIVKGIKKGRSR